MVLWVPHPEFRYPLPAGFNLGEGDVRDLNKYLNEEFSSLGYMASECRKAEQEVVDAFFEPNSPKRLYTDVSYSVMEAADWKKKINERFRSVLFCIARIMEHGGDYFPIPLKLARALHPYLDQYRIPSHIDVNGVSVPIALAFQSIAAEALQDAPLALQDAPLAPQDAPVLQDAPLAPQDAPALQDAPLAPQDAPLALQDAPPLDAQDASLALPPEGDHA